jgi:hypothetical protein
LPPRQLLKPEEAAGQPDTDMGEKYSFWWYFPCREPKRVGRGFFRSTDMNIWIAIYLAALDSADRLTLYSSHIDGCLLPW